jgi:hypothetical protein
MRPLYFFYLFLKIGAVSYDGADLSWFATARFHYQW